MCTPLTLDNFRLKTPTENVVHPPHLVSSVALSQISSSPPPKREMIVRKWIAPSTFGTGKCEQVVTEILVAIYTSFKYFRSEQSGDFGVGDPKLMKKLKGAHQYELDLIRCYQASGKRRDYQCILDIANYAGAAGRFPFHTFVPTSHIIFFARLNGYNIQVKFSSLVPNGLVQRSFSLMRPAPFVDRSMPISSLAFQAEAFIYDHWITREKNLTIAKHIINMMVVAYSTNLLPSNSL